MDVWYFVKPVYRRLAGFRLFMAAYIKKAPPAEQEQDNNDSNPRPHKRAPLARNAPDTLMDMPSPGQGFLESNDVRLIHRFIVMLPSHGYR